LKEKIIYWGGTGQAIVLNEFLKFKYETLAVFDNASINSPFKDISIHKGKKEFCKWIIYHKNIHFIVAIAGANGKDRIAIHDFLLGYNLIPASAIHPSSYIANDAIIGEANQILANSTIAARVRTGKCVIFNTSCSVDHECEIEDGVHIGPGAILAGLVKVNINSFIGSGAVVLPRIEIGKNTIIGAGSVVTKNIPDNVIVYGNPARIMKENTR
jgi:sugar O-acyltransferase (sialic acid O-acetyltransferase NeuD family)